MRALTFLLQLSASGLKAMVEFDEFVLGNLDASVETGLGRAASFWETRSARMRFSRLMISPRLISMWREMIGDLPLPLLCDVSSSIGCAGVPKQAHLDLGSARQPGVYRDV